MSAFANVSSANTETANRNKQGAKLLCRINKKLLASKFIKNCNIYIHGLSRPVRMNKINLTFTDVRYNNDLC